jgi:4'-phosphopantetheinyl transferase
MNSPLLVWMLYLNHEITEEEYEECYRIVHDTIPHCASIAYQPRSGESIRPCHLLRLPSMRAA